MDITVKELKYRCCFCNQRVEAGDVDPCDINIITKIDRPRDERESQVFYCHMECFKARMHDYARSYLVIDD